MHVRVEVSSLSSRYQSGVAGYTKLLTEALALAPRSTVRGHFFDFLKRQPQPKLDQRVVSFESNTFVPLKAYSKAQSLNIAPPFDILLPKVDLTIFPNFATWPTAKSKYTATVIHDLTYLYYPEVVEEKNLAHLRRVVPRSIKEADFIITVSESVKEELVKEFGLIPNNCVVTPIPPDDIFYKEKSPQEIINVKKKYKIPFEKYLYFIGNMEPRKNLIGLIRAYQTLPGTIKAQYGLVLAGGKGWKTEETERVLSEVVNAGENIIHLGYVDQADSPALYQGASLFVMPSLYEGFGMPILEAMASGVPVVANDIPILRETGDIYATYADAASPRVFGSAIKEALSKPINKKALRGAASRFTWEDNVKKIIAKTKDLLEK